MEMEYPEEYELLALFESEPVELDADVPFHYSKTTYKYSNSEKEGFTLSMTPSHKEVSLRVFNSNFEVATLRLYHIDSLRILSDNKAEKRIMLSGNKYVLKIQLKPRFSIQYTEEMDE